MHQIINGFVQVRNRHAEVAMIVGEEMADELEREMSQITRGIDPVSNRPILIRDEEVEFLALPEKHLAGFECEYCRNTYVVNLLNQAVKCPGCDHGAPYEAILLALNPIQKVDASYSPISGSYMHPDAIRYGQTTGSHPHADTIRFSQALMRTSPYNIGFYEPPRIPEPFPRVGAWYGELITNENRDRIHREMQEHYDKYGVS